MRPSMQLDLPSSRISSHLTRTLPHHRDCDNTIYEAHGTTHVAPVHGPSTEDRLWASMSITMTASSPESVATCVSEDKSRKRTALADADCRDDLRKRQRVANRLAQSCPGMLTVERKLLPCKADNGFNVIDAATVRNEALLKRCCFPDNVLISSQVQSLVSGEFGNDLHYFLLDCRFPYEYEGGHIMGALNIPLPSDIHSFFKGPLEMNSRTIFIFHCEFSSERAPEVYVFQVVGKGYVAHFSLDAALSVRLTENLTKTTGPTCTTPNSMYSRVATKSSGIGTLYVDNLAR